VERALELVLEIGGVDVLKQPVGAAVVVNIDPQPPVIAHGVNLVTIRLR
jgi:hypothetical protein